MDVWNKSKPFVNDLNRSFSVPNINLSFEDSPNISATQDYPFIRRVFVAEEIVHKNFSSPRIVRHYSYQELRSPTLYPEECSLVQEFSNFSFGESKNLSLNTKPLSTIQYDEPMELDISSNSSKLNNSFNKNNEVEDTFYENNTNYKTLDGVKPQNNLPSKMDIYESRDEDAENEVKSILHQPIIKPKKEIAFSIRLIMVGVMFATVAIFLSYVIFDLNSRVNVEQLKTELTRKIHGQKDAVYSVVNSLKYPHDEGYWHRRVKLLNFIGRSGVGKTLIANVVKEHFNLALVNDLHSSWLENMQAQDKVISNLYRDYLNLIVIDDLNISHLEKLISFIKRIDDDDNSDHLVLVIAIFSIQRVDDGLNYSIQYEDIPKIHKVFDKTPIYHEVIVFDEFSESDARNWLRKQFDLHEIKTEDFTEIEDRILDGHDVENHGFKKLHSKLLKEIQQINSTNQQ